MFYRSTDYLRSSFTGLHLRFIVAALLLSLLALMNLPGTTEAADGDETHIQDLWKSLWPQTDQGQTEYFSTLVMASNPTPPSSIPASTGFDYPVGGSANHSGFSMTNCFGCNYTDAYRGHTGEDYENGRAGDPVYTATEGVVVYRGQPGGAWGNVLIVEHSVRGQPIYTQYAHLQDMLVVPGQVVGRHQQIATLGSTGSWPAHLHFEIKDQPIIGHGYTGANFTVDTISAWGANYYKPSWFIANNNHIGSPFGMIDSVVNVPGGFRVSGWAIDPDVPGSIDVHLYVNGQPSVVVKADESRSGLAEIFPGHGEFHGFTHTFRAPGGEYTIDAYGINLSSGGNSLIGSQKGTFSRNPFGSLDGVTANSSGELEIDGWAIDPDTTSPINVSVYVDGWEAGVFGADGSRPDINTAHQDYGDLHGFTARAPIVSAGSNVCVYAQNYGEGADDLIGCENVQNSWDSFPLSTAPDGRHYFWPWYDDNGASNWLVMAGPEAGGDLNFDLNIKGKSPSLEPFGGPDVAAGTSMAAHFGGLADGPVVATSMTSDSALVSQRSIWKGGNGNSLEEVAGVEEDDLSSHYWWSFYDNKDAADFIMIANPGSESVDARIRIGEAVDESHTIEAGRSSSFRFFSPDGAGVQSGPVEVTATISGSDEPADIVASQRVLTYYDGSEAINEMPGIPDGELSDRYLWNYYDNRDGTNWIMISNPNPDPVQAQIRIGSQTMTNEETGEDYFEIPAEGSFSGGFANPDGSGVQAGPVEVTAYEPGNPGNAMKVIASQRTVRGPAFGEVTGYPAGSIYSALSSGYHWAFYDNTGGLDWIMVSNPNQEEDARVQVLIAGVVQNDPENPQNDYFDLPAGGEIHPIFFGKEPTGPVEVRAFDADDPSQPRDVLASQRVIWGNTNFNETWGTVPDKGFRFAFH